MEFQYNRRTIPCKNDPRVRAIYKIKKDYIRENALACLTETEKAKMLLKKNFTPMSEINQNNMVDTTKMDRRKLINLYTTYTAMFLY